MNSTPLPAGASGTQASVSRPNLIGVLGGMGPAATVDLLQKILAATPAVRDQDHVPLVVWNVPQIPDRPHAVLHQEPSPLPAMLEGARHLVSCGATAIAMPCNTAHHWAADLQATLPVPLLHIADAVFAMLALRPQPATRVALLATPATIHSGFYQRRFAEHALATLIPSRLELERIFAAIKLVKAGRLAAARSEFTPVAEGLLKQGADALLLGCTELPLLSPGSGFEAQCIDPTQALAEACVRHAFSRQPLQQDQATWRSTGLRTS